MGINFTVQYAEVVVREDIPKLSSDARRRIKSAIESKLLNEPEKFGKPLRRSLKGYRKLRVGDYRIIFRIEETVIKVFVIGHRSVIYTAAQKRLKGTY